MDQLWSFSDFSPGATSLTFVILSEISHKLLHRLTVGINKRTWAPAGEGNRVR